MPPRPIDSRNVYQKTLYAQHEVEKLHDGNEKDKLLRQQFLTEERDRNKRDQVELLDERAPTRRTEREARREKRKNDRKKNDQHEVEVEQELETDEAQTESRKRIPEDDLGKGDRLDIEG